MHTTLSQLPKLFDETNDLIEKSLDYPPTENFWIDFYPVMNPANFKNNHILYDQEVMAHVGVNFREIICHDNILPVGLLGGVAVKNAYRGKGFLKKLLNDIFIKHEKEVGLFILWSNLEQLYEKFNFFPAGAFLDGSLKGDIPGIYTRTKFKYLNSADFKKIQRIYSEVLCKEYFTFKRSHINWQLIKKIDSTELFISRDERGEINSYFCKGKGGDLKGVIHEVGYLKENKEQVLDLLGSQRLWLPSLGRESESLNFLGLFRIGNPQILSDFLEKRSGGDLKILEMIKNDVIFEFKNRTHSAPARDFLQYIFGPFPPKEFKDIACTLFFSGLDSI